MVLRLRGAGPVLPGISFLRRLQCHDGFSGAGSLWSDLGASRIGDRRAACAYSNGLPSVQQPLSQGSSAEMAS